MIHGGGWRIGAKANADTTRHKVPHFVGGGSGGLRTVERGIFLQHPPRRSAAVRKL